MLNVAVAVTVKMPDGTEVLSIGELDTVIQVQTEDDPAAELALLVGRVRSMLAALEQKVVERCDELVGTARRSNG